MFQNPAIVEDGQIVTGVFQDPAVVEQARPGGPEDGVVGLQQDGLS